MATEARRDYPSRGDDRVHRGQQWLHGAKAVGPGAPA